MAYDEELAERVRELLEGEAGLTEKKMFGGLGFMVGGNMAVAASGQGGLLVRVDPSSSYDESGVEPMVMRGREMTGWLRVATEVVGTKKQLATWVRRGVAYARSLPPK
jgi:TfoX/Sxy family transcriptional regulator of competence genes